MLVLMAGGCTPQQDPGEPPSTVDDAPAAAGDVVPPVVSDTSDKLLFSYVDMRGRIQAKSRISEVPEEVRSRVLVVDLSKSPEARQAHKVAFFADLSAKGPDGTYPVTVVSRYDASRGEAAPSVLPTVPDGTVLLYSASWCGYCKKAKRWMAERNVPFVERDVEKTPGAQAELSKKLKDAGIQGGGVPVLDWGGELIMGFNQARMEALLKGSSAGTQGG